MVQAAEVEINLKCKYKHVPLILRDIYIYISELRVLYKQHFHPGTAYDLKAQQWSEMDGEQGLCLLANRQLKFGSNEIKSLVQDRNVNNPPLFFTTCNKLC